MRTSSVLSTAHGTRREAFGPIEWGLLAAIALMWGSSFVFIEVGLRHFSPGLIAFVRILFGAAAVALLPKARRRIDREDWPRVAVLGLVWMAIPLTLFPIAQLWIDSSLAGMLNGAMPLFAGLIATMMLRRFPRRVQVVGLVLGFTGVVLLSWPAARGATVTLVGAILVLLATVLYGLAANIAVPLQQKYGSLPVVFRAQLTALIALAPVGLLSLPSSEFAWSSTGALLALGVLGSGVAFAAMATLAGRAGATRGAVAIYFVPVVAILLGVTLLDERVEVVQLVGMALVLAGAWLTSRRER